MKFTLTYTGDLKANASRNHKHELRKEFHKQLMVLWNQVPLSENRNWFDGSSKKNNVDLNRRIENFRFVPLVSPSLSLICELSIFMLKPEAPGAIITQGGDIDNKLKTLFDALRIPQNKDELPKNGCPEEKEDPFFCLLEDDALITGVTVKTDRLLVDGASPNLVHLDIQVETRATRMIRDGKILVGGATLT